MMTVRYPNGQAITYNDAGFLKHGDNCTWILKERENGPCIAFIQASAGAIVEFRNPCSVRDDAKPWDVVRWERREVVRPRLPRNFAEVIDVLARGGKPRRKPPAKKKAKS